MNFPIEGGVPLIRHPELSFSEGVRISHLTPQVSSWAVLFRVRISSDTTGVILSGAFPREDLIWHHRRHPERCFSAWGSQLLYFFVF